MPNLAKVASELSAMVTPLLVVNETDVDLRSYAVRIALDDKWDGWSYASPSGLDIFVLDDRMIPIPYFVAMWRYESRLAVIYALIPRLPPRSSARLNLVFGGRNPYLSYRDPSKVFLLYDDFRFSYVNGGLTNNYRLDLPDPKAYLYVYDPGLWRDVQWNIQAVDGLVEISVKDGNYLDGNEYCSLVSTDEFSGDVCIEAMVSFPDWHGAGSASDYRSFSLGFSNTPIIGGGGGDTIALVLDSNGVRLLAEVGGSSHYTSDLDVYSPSDAELFTVFKVGNVPSLGRSVLYFSRDGVHMEKLGELSYAVSNPMHAFLSAVAWNGYGTWRARIDWWIVRRCVEPEPRIVLYTSKTLFRDIDLT